MGMDTIYRSLRGSTFAFGLLFVTFRVVLGQDLARSKVLVSQKRWVEAKKSIDQTLARTDMQEKAEAWYVKGKICSALASDTTGAQPKGEDGDRCLQAFKRAIEIDREQTEVLLTADDYKPLFDLYTNGWVQGKQHYRKARYREAAEAFEETGRVGEYIHSQGWGLHSLDTTLTLWKALSAGNAGYTEAALRHFSRLADAGVAGKPEYAVVYRWLAKHCYDRQDYAGMSKYIEAGTLRYPNDTYLALVKLDRMLDEGDPEKIIPLYDRLLRSNPDSYDLAFQYANELFDATHLFDRQARNRGFGLFSGSDSASNNPGTYREAVYEAKCGQIEELYASCRKWRPASLDIQKRLGKHLYNEALILDSSKRSGALSDIDLKRMEDRIASSKKKAIRELEETLTRFDKGEWKYSDVEEYKSVLKMLAYCHMGSDSKRSDMYLGRLEDIEKGETPPFQTKPPVKPGNRGS
jgi:tetratricopeptide (TPR) repeat protein